MLLRPNPAAIFTTIDWKWLASAKGRIRFFDGNGLPRLEVPLVARIPINI